ncbi:F-box domain-containing protein [Heracleum sosnowskyi]|uniref:F-box domain-containing protein n=1 Tax=Heracleum sosnowskyi TaxID=360622 RepID=A0AAD8N6Z1_9APIA|nr:F-box domain-containing protein [Heracleum sosnowskyi]
MEGNNKRTSWEMVMSCVTRRRRRTRRLLFASGEMLENLKFPYSQGDYPFEPMSVLLGCQCGIVCVYVDVSDLPAANKKFDIYLWNPATKHSKLIPPHTIHKSLPETPSIGLGFDHIDLDFKVLKVLKRPSSAEVYFSNRNAWRKIEPKPIDVPFNVGFHVCLHGFLLTVGHKGMMAFDLNKEVFICNIENPAGPTDGRITEFNDSISVSAYAKFDDKVNLWTLDSEACLQGGGVKVSWTKILSVHVGLPLDWVAGLLNSVDFILVDRDGEWFFYNFKNEDARNLQDPPYFGGSEIFKYTKGLFSFEGSKRVKWTASS